MNNNDRRNTARDMQLPFTDIDQAQHYVETVGRQDDAQVNLFETALALSLFDKHDADISTAWDVYVNMNADLHTAFETLSAQENSDGAMVQAMALEAVLAKQYGFIGDDITYDDFRNINLFDVIDRRLGMPISLCIMAVSLCRLMGWQAEGVNFPGHFMMRLEKDGERLLIDPFQGCKILEAKDLRQILKRVMGEGAELSADYYNPCNNRDTILRHQNNLKFRLIDKEKYSEALNIVARMQIISPNDYRTLLDKAVLYARLEQVMAAIENIQNYIDLVPDPYEKLHAQQFLRELQQQLN